MTVLRINHTINRRKTMSKCKKTKTKSMKVTKRIRRTSSKIRLIMTQMHSIGLTMYKPMRRKWLRNLAMKKKLSKKNQFKRFSHQSPKRNLSRTYLTALQPTNLLNIKTKPKLKPNHPLSKKRQKPHYKNHNLQKKI